MLGTERNYSLVYGTAHPTPSGGAIGGGGERAAAPLTAVMLRMAPLCTKC